MLLPSTRRRDNKNVNKKRCKNKKRKDKVSGGQRVRIRPEPGRSACVDQSSVPTGPNWEIQISLQYPRPSLREWSQTLHGCTVQSKVRSLPRLQLNLQMEILWRETSVWCVWKCSHRLPSSLVTIYVCVLDAINTSISVPYVACQSPVRFAYTFRLGRECLLTSEELMLLCSCSRTRREQVCEKQLRKSIST